MTKPKHPYRMFTPREDMIAARIDRDRRRENHREISERISNIKLAAQRRAHGIAAP